MPETRKPLTRGALLAQQLHEKIGDDSPADNLPPAETALAGRTRSAALLGGKTDVVALHHLDPAQCRPSAQNARQYGDLTYESCRELIESILAEGAQKIPAIVRPTGETDSPYEIVAGSRRHFAISWLRANNYPEFTYLAQVQELQDEQAFRLSDIENRARTDISAAERGRSWQMALDTYYGGDVARMAQRLRISKRMIYHYLSLADLDPVVLRAFANPADLTIRNSRELLQAWRKDAASQSAIVAEAQSLAAEQAQLAVSDAGPLGAEAVLRRLVAAASVRPPKNDGRTRQEFVATSSNGRSLFTWSPPRGRGGLSITIPNDKTLPADEIKAEIGKVIDQMLAGKAEQTGK